MAASPITVQVTGEVRHAGAHTLPADARLAAAALAAQPTQNAYLLGAALLRDSARTTQARLKAGILFDLETLATTHRTAPALAEAAGRMHTAFSALPVTGREPQLLAPRALEADRRQNRPARDANTLVYPPRPETVTVTGAVVAPCVLRHDAARAPLDYRNACPLLTVASPDDLYLIEADGTVQKLGIALWNRGAPRAAAPGATIFVPLDVRKIAQVAPDFNEEAARFLATQVLEAPGVPH
ncbi:MAG: hypothetical protein GAK31_00635 [Stenotrophomonas maltophilia]|uniref:Capsule biosynthesis GfcC-like C-terminal domain-containing protein n=1 Tax=Stenotrophomonas maltophilia TaxID=40324 RepID=A0A7V8FJR4_STEMA|nr:MAG: hypothetical protein GAK31_00635 [Stenotrophomonas maltophilia]